MDQVSQDFTKKRNETEELLVKNLIAAYQQDKISYFEMKRAASYIIHHIDFVKNETELSAFLNDTAFYWPVFKDTATLSARPEKKAEEQQVINKLSSYIQKFS